MRFSQLTRFISLIILALAMGGLVHAQTTTPSTTSSADDPALATTPNGPQPEANTTAEKSQVTPLKTCACNVTGVGGTGTGNTGSSFANPPTIEPSGSSTTTTTPMTGHQ